MFNQDQTTLVQFPQGLAKINFIPAPFTAFGYSVPSGVTTIGPAAFYNCLLLTNLLIPANVTNISAQAFAGCTNLANIIFLGNAPLAGSHAFTNNAHGATVYYLPGSTGWKSTYSGVQTFQLASPSSYIRYIIFSNSAVVFPSSGIWGIIVISNSYENYPVTAIDPGTFGSNPALTSVVIPDSVTNIGWQAFFGCTNLVNVVIPSSVTSIGMEAFQGCTGLTKIVLPSGLTSIIIPSSVTNIGNFGFEGGSSLTNITFQGNAPTLGSNVFDTPNAVIYYYAGTTGWSNTFGGLPTVQLSAPLQPPQIGGGTGVGNNGGIGIQSGNFSFNINAASNQTVVIEASSNLVTWLPVWTNIVSGTNTTFSDPQWTNFPARYYRAR